MIHYIITIYTAATEITIWMIAKRNTTCAFDQPLLLRT